ncbi:IS3 family transposase [Streptomyces sp. CA-106110]|uniref:IS3 family transposase n=1 Tax=Streptomyces sp. CA-106110 TaxID=3240044 RepID=UPI003D945F9D
MLKVEYVHRRTFTTRTEARLKIAPWITGFYNTRRLHSVCGYRSPIDYEQRPSGRPHRGGGRLKDLHGARGLTVARSTWTAGTTPAPRCVGRRRTGWELG